MAGLLADDVIGRRLVVTGFGNKAGTRIRRATSRAWVINFSTCVKSGGLSTYSNAPRDMASIAVAVVPDPVMKMTGISGIDLMEPAERLQPGLIRQPEIQEHHVRFFAAKTANPSLPVFATKRRSPAPSTQC